MKVKKIFKKLSRKFIPYDARLKVFWRSRALALAFSSAYNTERYEGELAIARDFNSYLSALSESEKLEKIENLKKGLDTESQDEVERIIARQNYILHHNLIEQAKFFTSEELSEQKTAAKEIDLMRKKLKDFRLNNFNPESVYGLSGLRWLPEDVISWINNGVFLDIGAYDGDSALAFYYSYRPTKIYAFEPENGNYERLKKNNKILGGNIIIAIKAGVSDKAGKANISRDHSCSKLTEDESDERINLITLDEFEKENKLEKVNVIKMDIEGAELDALKGAENLIKKFKPVLAISIYHNAKDFFEIKTWLEELVPEYKFIIKKANPFSLGLEVMLLAYIN